MADVSKLRLDNVTYDIKDDNARKYLVMVNEEPVSATKMVVETGGDAIELATTDEVNSINERIDYFETTRLDRKFILIGDSYGMRSTPNWMTIFKSTFGSNVIYDDSRSSYGFVSSLSFISILQNATSTLTEEQRNSVTDIVVVGGWNDAREIKRGKTAQELQNAILAFTTYMETYYPNAILTIEFCGWQLATGIQDSLRLSDFIVARRVYDGTGSLNKRSGQSMLTVMLNPAMYDDSYFHPNNSEAAYRLYYALLNDLFGTGDRNYTYVYALTASDITFPTSGVSATASGLFFRQMDTIGFMELTFSSVSGLSNGVVLCNIPPSKFNAALWNELSGYGEVLESQVPFYWILNKNGNLNVYGTFSNGSTLIIRTSYPMILG